MLEYDEVSLLTDLGHEVFSNGVYLDPKGHITLPRPGIKNGYYNEELANIARSSSRTRIPEELIDPFDLIIIMSGQSEEVLFENWENIKHKKVVWRSIGQSLPHIEEKIAPLRKEGLKVVRYSPREETIKNYAGQDTTIRFYKDSTEFDGWIGSDMSVLNATQSLKGRRMFTGYDYVTSVAKDFSTVVLGSGNEDLGKMSLGDVSYQEYKKRLSAHRVFFYTGTWPASYTLSFIEALMMGIPVVAIGSKLWNKYQKGDLKMDTYEVPHILKSGINGFVSDSMQDLKESITMLMGDYDAARTIGKAGRRLAMELFDKGTIKGQWELFLKGL